MLRGRIFWDREPREMHQIKALNKGYWACPLLHLHNRLSLLGSADFSVCDAEAVDGIAKHVVCPGFFGVFGFCNGHSIKRVALPGTQEVAFV